MIRVAIQGELGAYSECAALDFFLGQDVKIVPCRDYSDLFDAMDAGLADCMIIPIENSSAGSVYPYYDLLLDYAIERGFRITSERKLRIRHNLIACQGAKLADIREVWSHVQAIDQCRNFLRTHKLVGKAGYDTAGAVKDIVKLGRHDVAAIASVQAAVDLGMEILDRDIQDNRDNYTRFLKVEREAVAKPDYEISKTSVVFCIANVQGSLFNALAAFGTRTNVSIIRAESRPLIGTFTKWRKFARKHREGEDVGVWDLLYYLDFVAPTVKCPFVIEHLHDFVLKQDGDSALQVLGSYNAEIPLRDITGEPWRQNI